jgi:hypothetical protein
MKTKTKIPEKINIQVCWTTDWDRAVQKGKVDFDIESMQEEFRFALIKLVKTYGTKKCIKGWKDIL